MPADVSDIVPVPGYDPEDLDDTLENKLTRQQKRQYLTDEEWETYRQGDASLIDLLDEGEIHGLLVQEDESVDATTE